MKLRQEIYESSTFGPIPLSFTGRRLLANLREATNEAIETANPLNDDNRMSKERARIALYISKLEQRATL